LLDTSVAIALGSGEIEEPAFSVAISALTLAELARGHATASSALSRYRREDRLRRAEQTFPNIPFDWACSRAYRQVCAGVMAAGRKPRRTRSVDLMIAATALAYEVPLYTLNASDLRGVEGLVTVVDLR
jgi:predicted nucleic acid-binding protein